MPFRVTCATCGETLDRDQFSKSQLINKSDGQRRCRQCVVRVILVHEQRHAPPAAHVVLLTPRARDAETGYVSYYDARKRFGFIRPLRGGAHVFFHGSKVRGGMRAAAELARKQVVAFRRVPSRKYSGKFNAHDVAPC